MLTSRLRVSLTALLVCTSFVAAACGVERNGGAALDSRGHSDAAVTTTTAEGQDGGGTSVPGDGEGTGGVVYLRKAAETTSSVESMSMEMEIEMTGLPLAGDMTITAEGATDYSAKKAHLRMDMSDMFDMLASLGGRDRIPEDAGIIEMIVDGSTTYMKSSLFGRIADADPDKPWFSASTEKVSGSEAFSQGTQDPKELLNFIRNAGGEVTEVGSEEVRGVPTTHLHTVVDIEALAANAPAESKKELEKSLEKMGADGVTEFPIDIWVDSEDRVRKFVMSMDLSQMESAGEDVGDVSMTLTFELFDFGEPVTIEVPSQDQVQELDLALIGN